MHEPTAGTVVARAGQRPAVLTYTAARHRVVELRLDLARSPLVLTPAFPILIADALDWLAGRDVQAGIAANQPVTRGESDVSVPAASEPTAPARGRRALDASPVDASGYLLAVALILVAVEWRLRPGGWRSARSVAAALLALAILGPRVPWGEAPRAIVFALDTSDSMSARRGDALSALARGTAAMRRGDRAGLVVFGGDATAERPLDTSPLGGATPGARTLGSATNIEHAIRIARATLPADGTGRVVLVSDGRETAGNARAEARAARAAGIPIDVLAPRDGSVTTARAAVTRVTAPPSVRQGEPFEIAATVEGAPGAAAEVVFEAA